MSGCGEISWDGDNALQAAVIRHVLDEHPATLTRADLQREVVDVYGIDSEDDLERAIRELAKAGLVEVEGRRVLPSRSAVRYFELTEFMA